MRFLELACASSSLPIHRKHCLASTGSRVPATRWNDAFTLGASFTCRLARIWRLGRRLTVLFGWICCAAADSRCRLFFATRARGVFSESRRAPKTCELLSVGGCETSRCNKMGGFFSQRASWGGVRGNAVFTGERRGAGRWCFGACFKANLGPRVWIGSRR